MNQSTRLPKTRPGVRQQTGTSETMLDNARSHGLWELTAAPPPGANAQTVPKAVLYNRTTT